MDLGEIVGINVRRFRKEQRLKKKPFALMVGIGRPFLDKIERGESNIRLDCLQKLADALQVTPQDLITAPTDPHAMTEAEAPGLLR